MKRQTGNFSFGMFGGMVALSFITVLALILTTSLSAQTIQNCPDNPGVYTKCTQIGDAEKVSVSTPIAAYPTQHPTVYWHDDKWKIDMLPQRTSEGEVSMKITSSNGKTKIMTFDAVHYAQVDSITRTLGDEAIIIGEPNGMSSIFSIVDLKLGEKIAGDLIYHPSISPDRRFLLYHNWYLPHMGGENLYSLYDTLKTPEENTCGYEKNNPEYKMHKDELDGIQVYPFQVSCLEKQDDSDDNRDISDFIWTTDSSRVVFADVKSGVMSLILVIMPHNDRDKYNEHDRDRDHDKSKDHDEDHDRDHRRENDRPRTLTYPFVGAENVCGDIGPLGPTACDNNKIRSIVWNGDAVNIALVQANLTGPAIIKNLTIPLSKFVPLSK